MLFMNSKLTRTICAWHVFFFLAIEKKTFTNFFLIEVIELSSSNVNRYFKSELYHGTNFHHRSSVFEKNYHFRFQKLRSQHGYTSATLLRKFKLKFKFLRYNATNFSDYFRKHLICVLFTNILIQRDPH